MYLTQSKHIANLPKKTKMEATKLLPTLTSNGKILSKSNDDPMDNPTLYRSIVRALQNAIVTRPDISYMVNKLS